MARTASGSSAKSPFWGGFALGLIAGLALAVTVALLVTKNNPFVSGPDQAAAPPTPQPANQAGPAAAPTYDFYKSLPASPDTAPANPEPAQRPAAAQQFWLQAGAFQHPEEADNMKAKLALLGVEASIETAQIPDKGTLYRVRVGPLNGPEELEATRKRLTDNSIPADPVKK